MQYDVVTVTLKQASIPIEELFLNANVGFDLQDFRKSSENKEINVNIYFNKHNGNIDRDEYFGKKLHKQRYAVEKTIFWMDSYRFLLNRLILLLLVE